MHVCASNFFLLRFCLKDERRSYISGEFSPPMFGAGMEHRVSYELGRKLSTTELQPQLSGKPLNANCCHISLKQHTWIHIV